MINYFISHIVCLTISYLFYEFVLKKEKNFQFNRFYLLGSVLVSILLPLIDIRALLSLTNDVVPSTSEVTVILNEAYVSVQESSAPFLDLKTAIICIYLTGVGFTLVRFSKELLKVSKVIKKSIKVHKKNYVLVKASGEIPTSTFLNYLIWNEDESLNETDKNRIILHELVHIKERHTLDVLFLEIMKVLFWFNPLINIYKKNLASIHEYQADRKVAQKTGMQAYVKLLARQAIRNFELDTVNYFGKNQTLKRINMMMKKNQRTNALKYILTLPVIGLMLFAVACQQEEKVYEAQQPGIEESLTFESDNEEASDEVFTVVDEQPTPQGGMKEFYAYIGDNLVYPKQARENGTEGRVFIQFVVEKDGSLTELHVIKGIGSGCDQAVLDVFKNYDEKWAPGLQKGNPVKVRMILPIVFKL